MITEYTLTDSWVAYDFAQVDPELRKQAADRTLPLEERAALWREVLDAATVTPDAADVAELDAIYERIRPEVPEGGVYELVALEAHRWQPGWWGVLDCRVDGKRVQVRF